ncbi:hypothetical protein HY224_02425 [Candidatus Uhrbacteria bacterium]|nr:hypothetical protein [Candidatus Uhrbacteria bacterium]
MSTPIPQTTSLPTPPPHSSDSSKMHVDVGLGSEFKKGKLDKTLDKLVRGQGLLNVTGADRKILSDIISQHARNLAAGSSFSYSTKTTMKSQVEHARASGQISSTDAAEFKKVIDNL